MEEKGLTFGNKCLRLKAKRTQAQNSHFLKQWLTLCPCRALFKLLSTFTITSGVTFWNLNFYRRGLAFCLLIYSVFSLPHFLFYMYRCFAAHILMHMNTWRGIICPGTEVRHHVLEIDLGPLKKQPVLLTEEPSLQSHIQCLYRRPPYKVCCWVNTRVSRETQQDWLSFWH